MANDGPRSSVADALTELAKYEDNGWLIQVDDVWVSSPCELHHAHIRRRGGHYEIELQHRPKNSDKRVSDRGTWLTEHEKAKTFEGAVMMIHRKNKEAEEQE